MWECLGRSVSEWVNKVASTARCALPTTVMEERWLVNEWGSCRSVHKWSPPLRGYLPTPLSLHHTQAPPLPSLSKHSLVQRLATEGLEGLKGNVGTCSKGQEEKDWNDGQAGHGCLMWKLRLKGRREGGGGGGSV